MTNKYPIRTGNYDKKLYKNDKQWWLYNFLRRVKPTDIRRKRF